MPLDSRGNRKRLVGFSCAINGLKNVFRHEINFRIHLLVAVLVISLGAIFRITQLEWIAICLTIGSVLAFEMMNTAVERAMDYLSPEIHPSVGLVKDISAGAVFITAINAVIVGGIIFIPKLIGLLL
ncbi:diacylglycerol kinase family protein [Aquibacillus sediminis]|uniref:diacylglycerol kinase family protein n=1 Tax=Aquibacillus sediminis TaxID=2574734 RepID=UPI001108A36D|nr:diacylglycerol kinase family protein [Aquibacillus sediminis]